MLTAKIAECLKEIETMKKIQKPIIDRRNFLKWSGGVMAASAAFPLLPGEFATADAIEATGAA